jgi:hypothetical protein
MNIIQVFFLTITPAMLFLILVEQIGFFGIKVIQTLTKSLDTTNQSFVLRIFVGLLLWTMILLGLGSLSMLYADLVKFGLVGIGIVIFLSFKRYKQINISEIKSSLHRNKYILLGVSILIYGITSPRQKSFCKTITLLSKEGVFFDIAYTHLSIFSLVFGL